MSSLERKIYNCLRSANLSFQQEKSFSDLHHGLYRFDFYLPVQNIAIEIQGTQHYEFVKIFYKNRSDFKKAQERDRAKIRFCLTHDITLYCIPYWEIDDIHTVEDIFQEKFIARSQFHNDDVWYTHKNKKGGVL